MRNAPGVKEAQFHLVRIPLHDHGDIGERLAWILRRAFDWYTGTADGGDTQNEMYSIGRRAPGWDNEGLNGTKLSSLSVSYAAVPEPSAAALSLLAFMGFAARRRRK